ncbi:SMI1/KNR4 family protein [Streptomyces lactacystinicus]
MDPALDDGSGLPLVAPFAGRLVELCGWVVGGRWIGCGIVRDNGGAGSHLVGVSARRVDAATAFLPAGDAEEGAEVPGGRWVRRLAAVTGRPRSGQWPDSVRADQFYWLTEGADPNRWPVVARNEDGDSCARFDGSTAEFVHRLLTDHRHPFSVAELIDRPDFEPYEPHDRDDPFEDRRLP